jgi:hypothetical protein
MFYLGANDQRVTLVDDRGHEVYTTDFRNFTNILTHLRPLIRAIALANPVGEVDSNLLRVFEEQMQMEKEFHSITALGMAPLDSRFLALIALAKAQTQPATKRGKPPAKAPAKGKSKKK